MYILAELALQGARLNVLPGIPGLPGPNLPGRYERMTFGTSSIGFDPADSAQYAAEAAPILGGPPSGAKNRIGTLV